MHGKYYFHSEKVKLQQMNQTGLAKERLESSIFEKSKNLIETKINMQTATLVCRNINTRYTTFNI